jgi:microcystin synthetase protein McyA
MNGYCKTYRIEDIQCFPGWNGENDAGERVEKGTICYVWDDFVVRSSPIRREKTLFTAITPEWLAFCKDYLQFEVPEEILRSLQSSKQRDEISPTPRRYIPFTSNQVWLIEELSASNPYYCGMVFSQPLSQEMPATALESIMKYIMDYHDAIRLRLTRIDDKWCQFVAETCFTVPFTWVCASRLSQDDQKKVMDCIAVEMQLQINTLQGYLWHAAFCETDDGKGDILWALNHFIYDGFSIELLLQDFHTLCQQAYQGKELCLPPKTASFEEWTCRIGAYLRSADAVRELREYWLKLPWHQTKPFPLDFPEGCSIDPRTLRQGYGTRSSTGVVTVSLGVEDTQKLLTKVVNRQTQVMDILLTAMALTFSAWNGSPVLSIFVHDNARLSMFDDIDLLHTVGCISQARRLLLDLNSIVSLQEALAAIKKQLRQAPNNGRSLDWFLRRDDGPEVPDKLKQLPFADLHFNFLGRRNDHRRDDGVVFLSSLGYEQSLRNHLLTCEAAITDGDMWFVWGYSRSIHLHSTIERLAGNFIEALKDIINDALWS